MSEFINDIGNRYGRLVIIARRESSKLGQTRWLCRCDCGNEKTILGSSLRSGKTKSCGCLQKEKVREMNKRRRLSTGEASFNALVGTLKQRAITYNHEWSLTKNQVRTLAKQNCHYCGIAPQQKFHPPSCNGSYIYNGLDRVDSSKGYTIDNVVSCCKFCNWAKHSMTIEQFKEWLTRTYRHFIEKSD